MIRNFRMFRKAKKRDNTNIVPDNLVNLYHAKQVNSII